MVRKFSRYFGRSPDRLGLEDVRAFQVYLVSQGISWPALNQTVCALRFFYGVTLDRAKMPERIAYARTPRKLPAILSADEVVRFLEAVPSLKARTALTTAYAAGLRASEAVSLKVADIDSKRMVIQVHHGKGAKDRTVMLSPQLLTILRTYWRLARPGGWLFPGRSPDKPIDVQVLHASCRSATKAVGLVKHVSVHMLRHSFATHLLESGVDIHCLVPGGALSADGRRQACRPRHVLSRLSGGYSSNGSRRHTRQSGCASPAPSTGSAMPMHSLTGSSSCVARIGSSMPSRRSARPNMSSPISVLHSPSRHRQQPPGPRRRHERDLPLARLPARQCAPADDARRARVHPPFPTPQPARRLSPHPPLRFPAAVPGSSSSGTC
jgi:site-specific recombinase XerD